MFPTPTPAQNLRYVNYATARRRYGQGLGGGFGWLVRPHGLYITWCFGQSWLRFATLRRA